MTTAIIRRTNVDSQSLASVGYDDDHHILEAAFNRGDVYRFFLVPRRVFDDLLNADSKRAYFNRFIRGRYGYAKLERGS